VKSLRLLSVLFLVLSFAHCDRPSSPAEGIGTLVIPLSATGDDGHTYTLAGATLTIAGPENHVITDTSASEVTMDLVAGNYTVTMGGDWNVTRDVSGVPEPVDVVLVSKNPAAFTISEGQSTTVTFEFVVTDRDGTFRARVTFEEGHWIAGTFTITSNPDTVNGNASTDFFDGVESVATDFVMYFARRSETRSTDMYGEQRLTVYPGPVSLSFPTTTDTNLQTLASSLTGETFSLTFLSSGSTVNLSTSHLYNDDYGFEISATDTGMSQDVDGYPVLEPFVSTTGSVILRRYNDAAGTMTDMASGSSSINFD
jgi:hypothetical protein